MDTSTRMARLGELSAALAAPLAAPLAAGQEPLVAAALSPLLGVAQADGALVLVRETTGVRLVARAGIELDLDEALPPDLTGADPVSMAPCPVPQPWQAAGVTVVAAHQLPGAAGVLLLAAREGWLDPVPVQFALHALDTALALAQTEEKLADLLARVNNAQQLANMGDYDWHIPTDVNTWSDQLFRIYGLEPQSLHPSYERFLSMIHDGDRDRIQALHQQAYTTGEPYTMIERIVRPDGEVRFLSSNGEVIMDAGSTPIRMRGTCIDVTDHVHADQERQRTAARFQGLVDSAPDAIMVLSGDQHVLEANPRSEHLLGGDPRGRAVVEILPGWPHGTAAGVRACGLDGRDLQLDVITAVIDTDEDDPEGHRLGAVFLRDAAARFEREALAARVGEATLRRRQALEINDNVVQGLVSAIYALDLGETVRSSSYLDRTLSAARGMMDDLLEPLDGTELQPGDLVRRRAAVLGDQDPTPTASQR